MAVRKNLHALLIATGGTPNVYFQPSEDERLKYPCIVYDHDANYDRYADNIRYLNKKRYSITVIDKNPDSVISDQIATLPLCSYSRHYIADNLHHYVYDIYH